MLAALDLSLDCDLWNLFGDVWKLLLTTLVNCAGLTCCVLVLLGETFLAAFVIRVGCACSAVAELFGVRDAGSPGVSAAGETSAPPLEQRPGSPGQQLQLSRRRGRQFTG